jgi:1-acyl-sn-glycerol-3-phosphate acyltransferase
MNPYRVPIHIQINRIFLRFGVSMLFRIMARVKVVGKQNVPLGEPYVIAMNHISIFDPPFVVCFWPEEPEVIGAVDLFEKKALGTILSMYGVIPVHRGEYDRVLLDRILAILKLGRPLIIAPEGTRSHEPAMGRAMPGVGYIIEHAQVPVIPVGLIGTTDDLWKRARRGEKPELEMRIGKPIIFPPMLQRGAERREARQKNADLIMRHIAGLLPEEYHGAYAGQAISA